MTTLASLASVTITSFLVIVLARAAWHKADHFLETVGFAQGYGLIPDAQAVRVVRALMLVEGLTVIAFLLPAFRTIGALSAAAIFFGYGVVMALALRQGRHQIDCGCGGAPQIVSAFTLIRNATLTCLSLIVAGMPVDRVSTTGAAIAIGGALVLMAIYATIEKLASHLPHIRQGEL